MIRVRPSAERGQTRLDWLDSRHTFSFGDYHDPAHMGFRALRVINDDLIAPGQGFGTHPHRDMEILSHVVEGALQHKDSLGTGSVIRPGEVQRMSAGTGVLHSEHNPSRGDPTRLLQIWILPETKGLKPGYEQRAFPLSDKQGSLLLIASRDAREGSVTIHQDVDVYAGEFRKGDRAALALRPGRHAWVQVVRGSLSLNGTPLQEGDGAAVSGEKGVEIRTAGPAEALVFDLA